MAGRALVDELVGPGFRRNEVTGPRHRSGSHLSQLAPAAAEGPRRGDWLRLLGHTVQYDVKALARVRHRDELGMLLITPSLTPVLVAEARRMGWRLVPLGDGYYRVDGAPYASYVALIDEVAEAEQDPVLAMFAHPPVGARLGPIPSDIGRKMVAYFEHMEIEALEGEELRELTRRFMSRFSIEERLQGASPEEILAHLTLEQRLAGLGPEERLAGLGPEERLAGLGPEERLAGLGPKERLSSG